MSRPVLALAFLLAACQAPISIGAPCTRQSDCPAALACRFGRCRSECSVNRDCGPSQSCITTADREGVCQLDVDLGCESGVGRVCPPGLVCANDRCINTCSTDDACPSDGVCRFSPTLALRVCVDPGRTDPMRPDGGGVGRGSPCTLVTDVCVGDAFACAVRDGAVLCWGDDSSSQHGDLVLGHDYTPTRVIGPDMGPLHDIVEVACGARHACARDAEDNVLCWGDNGADQLSTPGVPSADQAGFIRLDLDDPELAAMPLASADRLVLGGDHSLAHRRGTDRWLVWGQNADTELGDVSIGFTVPRASHAVLFDGAASIGIGVGHSCSATTTGVTCHSINATEALGDASLATLGGVTDLALGLHHSCALSQRGISCWGSDVFGQLGDGPSEPTDPGCASPPCSFSPRPVTLPDVTRLVQGSTSDTTCAITSDGALYCWGENNRGQIDDTLVNATAPVRQTGLPPGYVCDAAMAGRTVCAVVATNTGDAVLCWGENGSGQLGILPDGEMHAMPLPITLP